VFFGCAPKREKKFAGIKRNKNKRKGVTLSGVELAFGKTLTGEGRIKKKLCCYRALKDGKKRGSFF